MYKFNPLVALALSVGLGAYAFMPTPQVRAVAAGEVIINEYTADNFNGTEYVEILVTGQNVDLRGMRITDNEIIDAAGTLNSGEGVLVFGQDAFLESVPAGTLVTVYGVATGVTPDTVVDPASSDWTMVLAPGTGVTASADGLGGSFAMGTDGDALYLYLPGPDGLSTGTDNIYLDFVSWEADNALPPAGMADINLPSVADNAFYIGNTVEGNDLAANWTRFSAMPDPLATPGQPNPGQDLSNLRTPPVGDVAPSVSAVTPVNAAVNVSLDTNLTVTFSEPVALSGEWFALSCSVSGARGTGDVTVTGGPTAFTLDPIADFANDETCALTVFAAGVTDVDVDDPPDSLVADFGSSFSTLPADVCAAPDIAIGAVQGLTDITPLNGQVVTIQGVVVGDYEGTSSTSNIRGFYVQDAGDGNPETSDAIFVFNNNNNTVSVGQVVQVTGTAAEFQSQTQLGGALTVSLCGTTGDVTPTDITLPIPAPVGGVAFLERLEGMLVRLPQTLTVTEHFQLGRFGQVVVSLGRQYQPTHLVPPGGVGSEREALAQANALSRIIVDDGNNLQNQDPIVFGLNGQPLSASNTLRTGDTATGIVGVLTYNWAGASASPNAYRVRPVYALNGAVNFVSVNARPTAPAEIGGSVRAGSMNLLNYFNTFGTTACTFGVGGGVAECRGASDTAEFDRQNVKTVAAILALNPDVLAVNEIENDGYGAESAIQDLVNRLNAATAPGTYAFIDADAGTGQVNALGVDAIKVGIIYKPAVVTPTGVTAALNTGAFGQVPLNTGLTQQRNRPALAQSFVSNTTGGVFTMVANHLKSKGSSCGDQVAPYGPDPDLADGQGNCPATRTAAATEMLAWLATDPTGVADADVLIVGDLNSYAQENPIAALRAGGFTDLVESLLGAEAYSYVFDGQSGYLDYALASASLVGQVTGVTEYHINADEPSVLDYLFDFKQPAQFVTLYAPDQYRVSDHDPILVGLNLAPPPPVFQLAGAVVDGGVQGSPLTLRFDLTTDRDTSATFNVTLPANVEFVSATAGGALSGDAVAWTFAPLPAGMTSVDLVVRPLRAGDQAFAGTLAGEGSETSINVVASIAAAPLTVSAGADQSTPQGRMLTFAGSFNDGAGLADATVAWDFGDGTTSSDLTATHGFSAPGVYTATLTVTTVDGRTASDSLVVTVSKKLDKDLRPVLACVRRDSRGQYTAVFGYRNDNAVAVTVAVGLNNLFLPGSPDRGQPTLFETGLVSPAFEVPFRSALLWVLDGHAVLASPLSPRCP